MARIIWFWKRAFLVSKPVENRVSNPFPIFESVSQTCLPATLCPRDEEKCALPSNKCQKPKYRNKRDKVANPSLPNMTMV